MEGFEVRGVDLTALQEQADRQFGKLMQSHSHSAFCNRPVEHLFHPVFPWAG